MISTVTSGQSGLTNPLDRLLYLSMKLYLQDNNLVTVDQPAWPMAWRCAARSWIRKSWNSFAACRRNTSLGFSSQVSAQKRPQACCPKTLFIDEKGFGIPLAKWLGTDLKEFMLDTLSEEGFGARAFSLSLHKTAA